MKEDEELRLFLQVFAAFVREQTQKLFFVMIQLLFEDFLGDVSLINVISKDGTLKDVQVCKTLS